MNGLIDYKSIDVACYVSNGWFSVCEGGEAALNVKRSLREDYEGLSGPSEGGSPVTRKRAVFIVAGITVAPCMALLNRFILRF